MKKLNQILFISEETNFNPHRWFISFLQPEFQGGKTVEISEDDALKLLKLINSKD